MSDDEEEEVRDSERSESGGDTEPKELFGDPFASAEQDGEMTRLKDESVQEDDDGSK